MESQPNKIQAKENIQNISQLNIFIQNGQQLYSLVMNDDINCEILINNTEYQSIYWCLHIMQQKGLLSSSKLLQLVQISQAIISSLQHLEIQQQSHKHIVFEELLSECYLRLRETQQSIYYLEKIIQKKANSESLYFRLANFYYEIRQFKIAAELYRKAISINPNMPLFRLSMALIYKNTNEQQKYSVQYQKYQQLLRLSPNFNQQKIQNIDSYQRMSVSDKTKQYFSSFIWQNQAVKYYQIGRLFELIDQYTLALECYFYSNQKNTSNQNLFILIGRIFLNLQLFEQAKTIFQKVKKNGKNYAEANILLSLINSQQKGNAKQTIQNLFNYIQATFIERNQFQKLGQKLKQQHQYLNYQKVRELKVKYLIDQTTGFNKNAFYSQLGVKQLKKGYSISGLQSIIPFFKLIGKNITNAQQKQYIYNLYLTIVEQIIQQEKNQEKKKIYYVLMSIFTLGDNQQAKYNKNLQYFNKIYYSYIKEGKSKREMLVSQCRKLKQNYSFQYFVEFSIKMMFKIDQKEGLDAYLGFYQEFEEEASQNQIYYLITNNRNKKINNISIICNFIAFILADGSLMRNVDFNKIQFNSQLNLDLFKEKYCQILKSKDNKQIKKQLKKKIMFRLSKLPKINQNNQQKIKVLFLTFLFKFSKPQQAQNWSIYAFSPFKQVTNSQNQIKKAIIKLFDKLNQYKAQQHFQIKQITIDTISEQMTEIYYQFLFQDYVVNQLLKFIFDSLEVHIMQFKDIYYNIYSLLEELRKNKKFKDFGKNLFNLFEQKSEMFNPFDGEIKKSLIDDDGLSVIKSMKSNFTKKNYISAEIQESEKNIIQRYNLDILSQDLELDAASMISEIVRNEKSDISQRISSIFNNMLTVKRNKNGLNSKQPSDQKSSISGSHKDKSLKMKQLILRKQFDVIKIVYTLSKTPFMKLYHYESKFSNFNQLIYDNNIEFVKYFAKIQPKYIATYYFSSLCIFSNKHEAKSFAICMEKGQKQFSKLYEKTNAILEQQLLWMLGRPVLLSWLAHISLIIIQFQSLGIYNADLQIRNTIKFGQVFKAIDFDYAFQIKKHCQDSQPLFRNTRKMLKNWLETNYDQRAQIINEELVGQLTKNQDLIRYIFRNPKQEVLDQLFKIKQKIEGPFQRFTMRKKIDRCLQLLQEHMKLDHHQQFKSLIKMLMRVKNKPKFVKVLKQFEVNQILSYIETMPIEVQGYIGFVQMINKIYRFNQSQEDNQYIQTSKKIQQNQLLHKNNITEQDSYIVNKQIGRIKQKITVTSICQFQVTPKVKLFSISFLTKTFYLYQWIHSIQTYNFIQILKNQKIHSQNQNQFEQFLFVYSNDFYLLNSIENIYALGKVYIYSLISSLARIVVESQQLGIYLSNLNFNSMVRRSQSLKLKDLSKAFKINLSSNASDLQLKAYQMTQNLFIQLFLLDIDINDQNQNSHKEIFTYLFQTSNSQFKQKYQSLRKSTNSIINKVQIWTNYLSDSIKQHHFTLFTTLVHEICSYCTESIDSESIKKELLKFQSSKDYFTFSKNVENLYYRCQNKINSYY